MRHVSKQDVEHRERRQASSCKLSRTLIEAGTGTKHWRTCERSINSKRILHVSLAGLAMLLHAALESDLERVQLSFRQPRTN